MSDGGFDCTPHGVWVPAVSTLNRGNKRHARSHARLAPLKQKKNSAGLSVRKGLERNLAEEKSSAFKEFLKKYSAPKKAVQSRLKRNAHKDTTPQWFGAWQAGEVPSSVGPRVTRKQTRSASALDKPPPRMNTILEQHYQSQAHARLLTGAPSAGVEPPTSFQSLSLQFETAFAELICNYGDLPIPNKERTCLSFELFDDFTQRLSKYGTYRDVMSALRDELFSSTFTRDQTGMLVPYFEVAKRVSAENNALSSKNAALEKRIEQQNKKLQAGLKQRREIIDLRFKISKMEREQNEKNSLIQKLQKALSDLSIEKDLLEQRLQVVKVTREELIADHTAMENTELHNLRKQVNALQTQLQGVLEENDSLRKRAIQSEFASV